MRRISNPDLNQLAGAVEARQGKPVPAIGLDVITGTGRDQGVRDNDTS